MEVMSSLVLYALAVLLPHGLGTQAMKTSASREMKFNSSLRLQQKSLSPHKLLLNLNAPPMVTGTRVSELQSVFADPSCRTCSFCMEKAIKAHKHAQRKGRFSSPEALHEILTNSIYHHKYKRSADDIESGSVLPERKRETEVPEIEVNNLLKREKRTRTKKNKIHKSVSVTKFYLDDEVYSLKVKETDTLTNTKLTCTVYSVLKAFPCDSPDVEALTKYSKKHGDKKNKKATKTKRAEKVKDDLPTYKKRETDNSQLPENVMSSIEEFY